MGPVLFGLEALAARLRERPAHRLLGSGSLHAGLIEGGQEYSSYPARCLLRGERRTIPGETVDQVEGELRELLDGVSGSVRVEFSREPFEVDEQAELVRLVTAQAGGGEAVGVPFWADSALLARAGIPTVVYGPTGEGAHARVEWVDVASAERCAAVYLAVAESWCA